ncbi:GNAT family N-acetyltransferase [Vibrio parahaemolyticus]|uniref:GNAT family N-acetyltransferase n=2 Tax=Vibrionaceae TaxID=641 RepID=UPI0000D53B24|nr:MULTISPECIES: GNAT family N-acetyltransferase [Vibrio]OCH66591.1 acetyltransferase [Vibrio diabolicus]EAS77980.1 acetyltransferase, possible [Vibrio alginolyticus 12G01]EHR5762449.1 GNAT family N-acetyltransferase [Vibrio parahaemolyticus]EJS0322498.1 GNAT family N-acetyltransferase [Vibrio alginolyticus]ELA8113912.1 GNAT family N-acetyltransferase [Vibrio parahaemolyticus]
MMKVRKAVLDDLPYLVNFTAEEAREAEGSIKIPETLEKGILVALRDPSIATYWVLADENNTPVGSVSAVREWSDWNAGYYWWIQSMFLSKSQRGKGRMSLLLDAVKHEMEEQKGLELRLYVHKDNSKAVRAYQNAHFSKSDYEVMVLSD